MRRNGVTDIDGIKGRCRIDDETGCWNWAWGLSGTKSFPIPMLHLGAGICGFTKIKTIPAYRAAWLLAGKSIKPGYVVYRKCCNPLCCNPTHLLCGPRADMYGHYAATGRNKGRPERQVSCAKNREKMMVSPERVRLVESLLEGGMMQKDVALKMKMCTQTVRSIRLGLHINCTNSTRQRVIRGASVFALGACA